MAGQDSNDRRERVAEPVEVDQQPEVTGEFAAPPDTLELTGRKGRPYEQLVGARGPAIVYRQDRYAPQDLEPVALTVTIVDDQQRTVECRLRNVSQTGMAFIPPDSLPIEENDVVWTCATFEGHTAYEGRAVVRTVRNDGFEMVAGAEFQDSLLRIDDILQLRDFKAVHQSALDALSELVGSWQTGGYVRFKAEVAELSLFLRSAKTQFDKLERSLPYEEVHGNEDTLLRQALRDEIDDGFGRIFVDWMDGIGHVCPDLEDEASSRLKFYSRGLLHPYIMDAPLARRMFDKPMGYAGDYIVMNYLYSQRFAGNTLYAMALQRAMCAEAAPVAVRWRRDLLRDQITGRLAEPAGHAPITVLSVAAGPAQEIYEIVVGLEPDAPPVQFFLFDQDRHALQHAQSRLLSVIRERQLRNVQVVPLHDSIKSLLTGRSVLHDRGPFDFIYTAGLMDYLKERPGRRLIVGLHDLLPPGGTCWVGNFAPVNPSRWAMEHLYEWYLIHRNLEDLRSLARDLPASTEVWTVGDETTVNPFLGFRKRAD